MAVSVSLCWSKHMYRPLLESEGVFEEWDLASSEYEENDNEEEDTEEEMWNIFNTKECKVLLSVVHFLLLVFVYFCLFDYLSIISYDLKD